jgi:hypothetical protein
MNNELVAARRHDIRNKILTLLDDARPAPVPQSVLLRGLEGLECSLAELKRELTYLGEKNLLVNQGDSVNWKPLLKPYGVDLLEGTQEPPPGLGRVAIAVNRAEYHRRQEIRWRILRVIDIGRPINVTQETLWRALDDADLLLTQQELRRELIYLEAKGLIRVEGKTLNQWSAALTADGVDVVEYNTDSPVGVSRPPDYTHGG